MRKAADRLWIAAGISPMAVSYCVVVPFDRVEGGDLVPGEAKEAPNRDMARRRAQALADKHAGALAFTRTGDPDSGDFGEPEIIAVFGAGGGGRNLSDRADGPHELNVGRRLTFANEVLMTVDTSGPERRPRVGGAGSRWRTATTRATIA